MMCDDCALRLADSLQRHGWKARTDRKMYRNIPRLEKGER